LDEALPLYSPRATEKGYDGHTLVTPSVDEIPRGLLLRLFAAKMEFDKLIGIKGKKTAVFLYIFFFSF
jgi:hypothetical protein